ncbi:hypothetical protein AVEN_156801-1 [Araneus ventricosus]|uniref:Uncharacterized protein n=1 Tax=Araneus ventricosus TaxID=182803 RepID=A0A4Y2IT79_ARAVE|nr:hypothetical protein AVEN_156801-1 [Araneus ventricosus]
MDDKPQLRSYALSLYELYPRFALFLFVRQGTRHGNGATCRNSTDHSPQERTSRFDKAHAVGTARLVGIPPTTVHKYEPRATRGLTSYMPWEQGFRNVEHVV